MSTLQPRLLGPGRGAHPVVLQRRARELALLGGFERLRDFLVPRDDLPAVARAAATRAGNQANPRPATPEEIEHLLVEIW